MSIHCELGEIFVVGDRTTEGLNSLPILLFPLRYEAKETIKLLKGGTIK